MEECRGQRNRGSSMIGESGNRFTGIPLADLPSQPDFIHRMEARGLIDLTLAKLARIRIFKLAE